VSKGQKVTKPCTSENLILAQKETCQITDSSSLTFLMHGNVRKDAADCFDVLICISDPIMLGNITQYQLKHVINF